MKKASKKWFAFNFDETKASPTKDNSEAQFKAPKQNLDVPVLEKRAFNFHKRLAPKVIEDLAVHPKKVAEVTSWLQNNVNRKSQTTRFLLITGPTGCGKTSTIKVLSRNMCLDLSEWINPVDQEFETFKGPNQVVKFTEFLTETKWNSLFSTHDKKIILVEEFPNALIRTPEQFVEVLDDCYYKANHPIIFTCTESTYNKANTKQILFPQEILAKYEITHISFNSCAPTLMKTALKRAHALVQANLDLFKTPAQETVAAITATSMGDIRCAINQYYFASLLGTPDLPDEAQTLPKIGAKRKRKNKGAGNSVVVMSRDETLDLFHGLGRVLNPKRGDSGRFTHNLEKLIDGFSTQPNIFTAFLFENYVKYFGDLTDVMAAADELSLAQKFLEKWVDRHDVLVFALWVSVLGLMVHNEHKVSKWNQIKGPRKVEKRTNNNPQSRNLTATDLFYYNKIKGCDSGPFTTKLNSFGKH